MYNNLNSIILEGNLTRDPDYNVTVKGTPVCNLSVASNRYYKQEDEQKEEVSFFNVEVWSTLAERCSQYLKKGRGVRVVGRLKQDRWKNDEGSNRERIKIVAEHVEFRPKFGKTEKPEEKNDIEPMTLGDIDQVIADDEDLREVI